MWKKERLCTTYLFKDAQASPYHCKFEFSAEGGALWTSSEDIFRRVIYDIFTVTFPKDSMKIQFSGNKMNK